MRHRNWLIAAASAVALGFIAMPSQAAPVATLDGLKATGETKCSWCTVGIGSTGTGSTTATDRACTFMLGRADATTVIITIGVITTTKQADFQAELGLAAG